MVHGWSPWPRRVPECNWHSKIPVEKLNLALFTLVLLISFRGQGMVVVASRTLIPVSVVSGYQRIVFQTSSIRITWELIKDAHSLKKKKKNDAHSGAPSDTHWIRNFGVGLNSLVSPALQVILMNKGPLIHISVNKCVILPRWCFNPGQVHQSLKMP